MASKHKCTDVSAKGTGMLMIVDNKIGVCSCWKEFYYE